MKFSKLQSQAIVEADLAGLSFLHLQAELSRIDVLIRRAVRLWQISGQNPEDALRGLYASTDSIHALATRRFGANWSEGAILSDDEAQAYASALTTAQNDSKKHVDIARKNGVVLRLIQLARTFQLTDFDIDALLVCLAPALDLRYEQLYGFLQDDVTRKQPSVNLILDLLCAAKPERLLMMDRFAVSAPLMRYQIVERLEDPHGAPVHMLNQTLRVNETIVAWLLGWYQPQSELAIHLALTQPTVTESDSQLLGERMALVENSADTKALLVFYGPDQMAQRAAVRHLVARMRRPLLTLNLTTAIHGDITALSIIRAALRDARLTDSVLCLTGWEEVLSEDAPPASLLEAICLHPDLVVIMGQRSWQARQVERDRNLIWLDFPIPDYVQRLSLWRLFIGQNGAAEDDPYDLHELSGQFQLTAEQIRDAVTAARDEALQHQHVLDAHLLFAAARAQSSPNLGNLARKIAPRYSWQDIVLPDDQQLMLHELVQTVRGRPVVLEQWGLGKKLTASDGVTVLFAGPPGTGKTMAAEVVASELGLDLYKIDLSTIVSKYIGETEKNLDRIFSEAESSNAILFFDEADAIFGKRSEVKDAHDRYANIEVSYLLQRMEAYNGVTVLATNLRANLDDAFTRRLQFAIDFPFPDEVYRARIWKTLFPSELPRDESIDFNILAKRFRLAGGNIRNIIVSAAYLAVQSGGKVTMEHLLHGARRELQKMGRLVNEKDMTLEGLR